MSRTFFASDLHLGHRNIVNYTRTEYETIQQHDADLVQRWNATVTNDDAVWVLGDVCFGKAAFENLAKLKGRKKLVMGNHDAYPISAYQPYFTKIFGAAEVAGYVLTHIPVHESQFYRYKGNIHGHLHSRVLGDDRYFNCSMEQIGMRPILLEHLLERKRSPQ